MGCPLQPKPGAGRASAIAERRPVFWSADARATKCSC
jgi:hypothetical protein